MFPEFEIIKLTEYLILLYLLKMRLLGVNHIEDFIKKHKDANALKRWQKLIESTDFKSMNELRKTFSHADYVDGKTIFNISGNKIRMITIITYGIHQVIITDVLTHQEYDQNKWKD